MSESAKLLPDHVRALSSLDHIGTFAQDPDVLSGKVNLALISEPISPQLDATLIRFVAHALTPHKEYKGRMKNLICSSLTYKELQEGKFADLAHKFMLCMRDEGINLPPNRLMPLANDIIRQAKAFISTYTVPEEKGTTYGNITLLPMWGQVETVSICLEVEKYDLLHFGELHFDNYGDETPKLVACKNYGGQGMIWYPNDRVNRGLIDANAPQQAFLHDPNNHAYESLDVGQTAYYLTSRAHGLATYRPRPLRPEQLLSVFLYLHRSSRDR